MKPAPTFALVLVIMSFGLPAALSAQGKTGRGADAPITVEFVEPEKYTDFGTTFQPTKEDRNALAQELRSVAERYVPEGYQCQ